MNYVVYLSERCNLACTYCETPTTRGRLTQDAAWELDDLCRFLSEDDDLSLWLFGGEPLLRVDLVEALLERLEPVRAIIQTNGLHLDRIPDHLLPRLTAVVISLDGPREYTDRYRGAGTYDGAIGQGQKLRARGYRGRLDVRLTANPGFDIHRAVNHFLGECDLEFDVVHWQLNAPFDDRLWRESRRQVQRWITALYNPQITRLIDEWSDELERGRLRQIVPFARVMHTLLTGRPIRQPQCGAGADYWTVTTDGNVYPCPVLRSYPRYSMGSIRDLSPATLRSPVGFGEPCVSCRLWNVCGGRCLYAHVENQWDDEGYRLVCDTVAHLVDELRRVQPAAERAVAGGVVTVGDFASCAEHEVIP